MIAHQMAVSVAGASIVRMKPRVASPKVNTTPVLRNRGAGELVDGALLLDACAAWFAIPCEERRSG
jgi:hypothetical protein